VKENFKIVRLGQGDVRCKTDHLASFEALILENERVYPEIADWYRKRVLPGIRDEERVAFIGYLGERPAVSAIVKKGPDAKFCHLKIVEPLRNTHVGEVFFALMALEARDLAKNIYFTLPEEVWKQKAEFFQSFGFKSAILAEKQYRLFDRELHCDAPFSAVWDSVLHKIPKLASLYSFGGFSPDNQLLLSIKPEFAERILNRNKRIELRRKFSTKWLGYRINLYASSPVMSLVGEARIAGITVNEPDMIWEKFGNEIGCSRAEFDAYCVGTKQIYAIELDEVKPYRDRIPLVLASQMIKEELVPPQSYFTLEKNRPWAKAISLAAYLHCCFKSTISLALNAGISARCKPPVSKLAADPLPMVQPELDFS